MALSTREDVIPTITMDTHLSELRRHIPVLLVHSFFVPHRPSFMSVLPTARLHDLKPS